MSRGETVKLLNDVYHQFVMKHKLKSSFGWLLIAPGKARVEFDGYSITVRFRIESESSDHGIAHLSSIRSVAEADVLIDNDHLSLETLESAVETVKRELLRYVKTGG